MFFYISFLRPPPSQAATFGNLSITPQIANDLRTEPFNDAQDIFYSWSLQSQSDPSLQQQLTPTKPAKLTTWRQSSAYKEIPVPPPPGIRDGQSWRLILSAQGQGLHSTHIDLSDESLGRLPFPVISMPILFGRRNIKAGGKQERIERLYRLSAQRGGDAVHVSLKVTEQTSFDLDKKIWDSGIGLSSWLLGLEREDAPDLKLLKDALSSDQPRNILELGAGTGIVSLALATIRSSKLSAENSKDTIVTTDLYSAMPLLEHNINANKRLFANASPQATVLDWDEEILPDYIQTFRGGFDVVVMADVTYNTASFPSLVRILSSLARLGPKPPLVLLGYKERHSTERTLWDMVRGIGLILEKIGERGGAGGVPVEIWLGQFKPS